MNLWESSKPCTRARWPLISLPFQPGNAEMARARVVRLLHDSKVSTGSHGATSRLHSPHLRINQLHATTPMHGDAKRKDQFRLQRHASASCVVSRRSSIDPRRRSIEGERERKMWPSSLLPPVLYPPPASAFVTAMSVVSFASLASAGLSELRGEHMAYSKFWHVVSGQQQKRTGAGAGGGGGGALLASRDGMLVAYAPALVAAAASFAVPGAVEGLRAQLLAGALALHFLKRVLEVLFIHKYSGSMPLNTALTISSSYLVSTVTMIYAQHLAAGLPDPPADLLYPGVLVFTVGIAGNLYHHYLLSQLRKGGDGDKGYKIPRGGLFDYVTCPHYLFEITGFFGFAMISQTVYALAVASGTAAYLAGRSCATRRWYESKFDEFPARIKALVPYIL